MLVETEAFEGVFEASSTVTELGFEGIVEAFDRLGQGCSLGLVAFLLFEVLAVVNGILIAAGADVRGGVVGVLGVFLEDRIFVEDEIADTFEGELTLFEALCGEEGYGFVGRSGADFVNTCLDGFLLDAQFAQLF